MNRMKFRRHGFSLVELAVVIVIVGVLAAFGVPRYRDSVERTKAAEAFNYMSAVRSAQERHLALKGLYSGTVASLDMQQEDPKYFDVPALVAGGGSGESDDPAWQMVLTRKSDTSSYGDYTVVFRNTGYVPVGAVIPSLPFPGQSSTIPNAINPIGE